MAKKKNLSLEELLQEVLVPEEEQPYKVPNNWVWVKLGSLVEVKRGASPRPKGDPRYFGGEIPWLKISDISRQGKYIFNTVDGVTEAGKQQSVWIEEGTMVLSISASVGKPAILKVGACIHDGIVALRNLPELLKQEFLYNFLITALEQMNSKARGAAQVNINSEVVRNIAVPLPPLLEQERIVGKLESFLNKINDAKQLIEEARETFAQRRAAILAKAFRGELTKKWREVNSHLVDGGFLERLKSERLEVCQTQREREAVHSSFNEVDPSDSSLPFGWLALKTNMFCHNISCGKTPTKNLSLTGEVPFLKVYNIVNDKIDFNYRPQFIPKVIHDGPLKSSRLIPGDIIMNIVGPPLRKIAIIPDDYPEWNMNQAIVRFRPIKSVNPKYIYYCLMNEETLSGVINETRGVVGQSNISVSQSRNLEMPIPPLEEQNEIIRIIDSFFRKEEQIDNLSQMVEQLEAIKEAILTKAFRGELSTNDLTEESALGLLQEVMSKV